MEGVLNRNAQNPSNGIASRVTGDNYREYKKYLEVEKMNRAEQNGSGNIINNNLNNTASKINSRVPFTYTPINNSRPTSTMSLNNNYPYQIGGTTNVTLNRTQTNNIDDNINLNLQTNDMSNMSPISQPFYLKQNPNQLLNNLNNMEIITTNDFNKVSQEIDNLKLLLTKSLENQNEMQNKIIEYNKIINEQENIIRLNNLKLNEHDNKLTEILLSFNNYLQLNEKTSNIVNNVQKKMEDCIKVTEFTDLKSAVYTLNKENESKINTIQQGFEEVNMKVQEMQGENENYQKFTLEKLKNIQKESMDSRLEQQNELIKMEESKENRINAQIAQIKNLIMLTDNNLKQESEFRKNMLNELRNEVLGIFCKKDEQMAKLEKVQLETEKNLIHLSKDYMGSFNELINKHNEKYDLELKAIRSLIEAGLTKVDNKLESDVKNYEENLAILKGNILEVKGGLAEMDSFSKDNFAQLEAKFATHKNDAGVQDEKINLISKTLNEYMEKNNQVIVDNQNLLEDKLIKQFNKELEEHKVELAKNFDKMVKGYNDLKEKTQDAIDRLEKMLASGALKSLGQSERGSELGKTDDPNIILIREYVQKLCTEYTLPLKEMVANYETNVLSALNKRFDELKTKFGLDQVENLNRINDGLEKKMGIIIESMNKQMDLNRKGLDGKVQEYVVEAELRINKKYDDSFKKMKEDLDSLIVKVGIE